MELFKQIVLFSCGLSMMSLVAVASTKETSSTSVKRGENLFVIGVGDYDYLPYTGFVGKKFAGFGAEVLEEFAKSKGYKFEYKALSVPRMFKEFLDSGSVDFMYPNNRYWNEDAQKKKDVVFSEPVVEYIDGVLVLEENKDISMSEFKSLAIMKGFDAIQYKRYAAEKKVQLFEHSDIQGLLRMIQNGRMQGAYLNPVVAAYQQKSGVGRKPLFLAEGLPYLRSSYLFSTVKYPKVIEEFNNFLRKEKELIEKLKIKYAVDDPFLRNPQGYKAPAILPIP